MQVESEESYNARSGCCYYSSGVAVRMALPGTGEQSLVFVSFDDKLNEFDA